MLTTLTAVASLTLGQFGLNLNTATSDYREARDGGHGRVVILGDSLTYRTGGVWENMVEISTAQHGSGGLGYQGITWWTGASYAVPQWTHGQINSDTAPHWSLDGLWVSTTNAASLTMTPRSRTCKLHYVQQPGGGSFTLQSGSNTWQVNTDGAQDVRELALSLPASSFVVTTQGNGSVTLLGVVNESSDNGPVIHRVANGGWGLDEVTRRNWTWDRQMQLLDPQVVIVNYGGQNDWAFSWNTNSWRQYLIDVCNRIHTALPNAEIILVSNYASGTGAIADRWATLSSVQRQLASERGYGFIDVFRAGGTYEYWTSSGMVDPDGVHFTDAGGYRVASIIHCAMETDGQCLAYYPCDAIDFNRDSIFPDDSDLRDFLSVFAGYECEGCSDIDFNNDGLFPDDADMMAFLRVLAGGACVENW